MARTIAIATSDIAQRRSAAVGEEIDRRKVVLDEPIRSLGEHQVVVHLVGRLRPQVTVNVVGEHGEQAEPAEQPAETAAAEE